MPLEQFSDIPVGAVTSGGTTAPAPGTSQGWTVTTTSVNAFPGASNSLAPPTMFHVADPALPSETIAVTNVSGTAWTVTRGVDGTTPVAHTAGFTVYQVVSAGALGMVPQVYNVRSLTYGAKGDGTTDDTAAIQAAVTAAISASGGVVYLPAGKYKVSSAITAVLPINCTVVVTGAGMFTTTISFTGTGDCLRMYCPTVISASGFSWGSGVRSLSIDGTSAGNGSSGLHIGDLNMVKIDDLCVQNFAGTGSIGINFDNTVAWTEQADVRALLINNTRQVVFQVTTGYPSFGYGNFDFTVQCHGGQDGVVASQRRRRISRVAADPR